MEIERAVSMLINHLRQPENDRHRLRFCIRKDEAQGIANLIESLSREAELGRAAIKAVDMVDTDLSNELCSEPVFDNSRSCQSCAWQDFCRLRARKEGGE